MWTSVGWTASQDTNAVLTVVTAIADAHVRAQGNDITVPPGFNKLLGMMAFGATISRAQLQAPSLRRELQNEIAPVNLGAAAVEPSRYVDLSTDPVQLMDNEGLEAFVAETAAGAEREWVFALLGDGPPAPINGDVRTVRATGTTTLVANAWTLCPLTLDQTLPAGMWALVGMRARSATGIWCRLVFVGGIWRPGAPMVANLQDPGHPVFRRGNMGEWGRFQHNVPPSVEILASAADTAETLELDVVQIA